MRTYENFITDLFKKKEQPIINKYKVGDYVVYDPFQLRNGDTFYDYVGKIVDIHNNTHSKTGSYTIEGRTQYGRLGTAGVLGMPGKKFLISQLNDRDFERLLTQEEIEELEYRENINKYNL
jgi:hypothetical protein